MLVYEVREPVSEVKFLIDTDCADAIGEWARLHMEPDPHAREQSGCYRTTSLYFDTLDLDVLYQRGSYARSKYRVRRYGDGDGVFLERKLKKEGVVSKKRSIIRVDELGRLERADTERGWNGYWFHRRLIARQLSPVCQVAYRRMARVSEMSSGPLRLTLDRELRAHRTESLQFDDDAKGIVLSETQPILELKFRYAMPALFTRLMEEFSLNPQPVSKYRLAAAALGIGEPLAVEIL